MRPEDQPEFSQPDADKPREFVPERLALFLSLQNVIDRGTELALDSRVQRRDLIRDRPGRQGATAASGHRYLPKSSSSV